MRLLFYEEIIAHCHPELVDYEMDWDPTVLCTLTVIPSLSTMKWIGIPRFYALCHICALITGCFDKLSMTLC